MNAGKFFRRGIYRCFKYRFVRLYRWGKFFTTPGLNGVPVASVIRYFFKGIANGAITTRASAVAFSFFLATVPTLMFLFTLIPYLPIINFHQQLLALIKEVMPAYAYQTVENTLVEVITRRSGGLLSFGFLAALFFSHNGVSALIDAFNATYHSIDTRSFLAQHFIALVLTFLLPLIVVCGVALMFFGKYLLNHLVSWGIIEQSSTLAVLFFVKWILSFLIFFIGVSLVYYLAPAKKEKFRFFSPGSIMATLLIILTSLGFSFYVNHFGQYNKFYGSLGGLIAFQLWLYFNAFGLILGFDLNASIKSALNGYKEKINVQLS